MRKDELNKFSETAEIYAGVRPTYPQDMYRKIGEVIPDMAAKKILEVGPGPGNATHEFLQYFPASITACEPNPDFCRLFENQFVENSNVVLKRRRFEDNTFPDQSFDIIFAATTFHWLDAAAKYTEASRLLTPGGSLILCWNNYFVMDAALKEKLSNLFDLFGANIEMVKGTMKNIHAKIERRKSEVQKSAYFSLLSHDLFEVTYTYSADRFCNLLKTFADQSLGNEMGTLLDAVHNLVLESGNRVDINVITNLEVARKTDRILS